MKNYIIMTDSCCDLPEDIKNNISLKFVPMMFSIGDNHYTHYPDYREIDRETIFNRLAKGEVGKTSGVNLSVVFMEMEKEIEKGNDILYLSFSSQISMSYNSAINAVHDINEKYPEARIHVIDTLCGCLGQGLIVNIALNMKKSGKNFDEVAEYIEKIKGNICHYFVVDSFDYLKRSGRIGALTAFIGGTFGIKPIFTLDEEGKVSIYGKIRGKNQIIKSLTSITKEKIIDTNEIFIAGANSGVLLEKLEESIKEAFSDTCVKSMDIGPMIGVNVGPGAVAVAFIGKDRK